MKDIQLTFLTSEGTDLDMKPINPTYYNVTMINVPEHVILECARRYITICMQSHKRRGTEEYGKIDICGETLTYRD